MPTREDTLTNFLRDFGLSQWELVPLAGDGSARRFFRVVSGGHSYVLILPQPGEFGQKESVSYAGIGRYLLEKGLPVPRLYAYDQATGLLLVEDLGDTRLEDLDPQERFPIYRKVIEVLVTFQAAGEGFDTILCLETTHYDRSLMWQREACYFVEAYLKERLGVSPSEELLKELQGLCEEAAASFTDTVLLHRDFQSRNIMVQGGKPYLIDFQGARLGPPAYDLASLLLDPYAALSPEEQETLLAYYLALSGRGETSFRREFRYLYLMRNLQILGAFARLTALGKEWFAAYIPRALTSLREQVETHFPYLVALRTLLRSIHSLPGSQAKA